MARERPEPTEVQVNRMAEILQAAYPRAYPELRRARRAVRHCHWVLSEHGPEPEAKVSSTFVFL